LTHLVVSLAESLRGSTDHVTAIRTGPGMLPRYVKELTYCTPLKVTTCGLVALPTHTSESYRHLVRPKRRYIATRPYGITYKKTVNYVTTVGKK